MSTTTSFLDDLAEAAEKAAVAEKKFRREAGEAIKLLECERAFAFRRLNFVRAVASGIKGSENVELAIAGAVSILQSQLGWPDGHTDAQSMICNRFTPVAETIFASMQPSEQPCKDEVTAALAAFESWYSSTHSTPFWVLFEHPMTETPRVDF
jgi:hypothetical protein